MSTRTLRRISYGVMVLILLGTTVLGQRPAAIGDNRVMFPFYLRDAACATSFAVLNQSGTPANFQMTLYGPDGQPVVLPTNPLTSTLGGNRQLPKMGSELFGAKNTGVERGWVDLLSDQPIAAFFQFLAAGQIDGANAFTTAESTLYFTRVIQNGTTSTHLTIANPEPNQAEVRLSLQTSSGIYVDAITRTIPGHGTLQGTVAELFGVNNLADGYVIADVTQGGGIIGFELIRYPQAAVGLNAQPASSQTKLYSAQYAQSAGVFTNLRVLNTTNVIRRLTVTAINESGQTAAGPAVINLGGRKALEYARVVDLFPSFKQSSLVASLKVEIDGSGLIGDVLFGHPQMTYAAALPLQDTPFTKAMFSHVGCGMGFYTGLGLYNPGSASASVTVRVYKANGQLTGSNSVTVGAGRRIARLLDEQALVPAAAGQVGGYVVVESTQGLVAQQLFGLNDFSLLSAVPAVPGAAPAAECGSKAPHSGRVYAEAFTPDGKFLVTGGQDNTIKIWSMPNGIYQKTLTGHTFYVHSLAISSNGQLLASGSSDQTIKLWSLPSGTLLKTLTGHLGPVKGVAISPDGTMLASAGGSGDYTAKLWSLPGGTLLKTLSGHNASVNGVAFSPSGNMLASGSADYNVRLWSIPDGTLLKTIPTAVYGEVHALAFSKNGAYLAAGGTDALARVWSIPDGTLLKGFNILGPVSALAFTPNNQMLLTSAWNGTVKLWQIADGALLKTIQAGPSAWSLAISPDGGKVAYGGGETTPAPDRIKLWSLPLGEPIPACFLIP